MKKIVTACSNLCTLSRKLCILHRNLCTRYIILGMAHGYPCQLHRQLCTGELCFIITSNVIQGISMCFVLLCLPHCYYLAMNHLELGIWVGQLVGWSTQAQLFSNTDDKGQKSRGFQGRTSKTTKNNLLFLQKQQQQ